MLTLTPNYPDREEQNEVYFWMQTVSHTHAPLLVALYHPPSDHLVS